MVWPTSTNLQRYKMVFFANVLVFLSLLHCGLWLKLEFSVANKIRTQTCMTIWLYDQISKSIKCIQVLGFLNLHNSVISVHSCWDVFQCNFPPRAHWRGATRVASKCFYKLLERKKQTNKGMNRKIKLETNICSSSLKRHNCIESV